ncbi:MAG: hypothetical protein ACR2NO_07635 [Chloroflexota bacterium]
MEPGAGADPICGAVEVFGEVRCGGAGVAEAAGGVGEVFYARIEAEELVGAGLVLVLVDVGIAEWEVEGERAASVEERRTAADFEQEF